MPALPRVVAIDGHPLFLHSLRSVITPAAGLELVATAETLGDGLERVRQHRPDLVLTEVRLPDGDGIDLIRQLPQASPDSRGVVLTGTPDERDLFAAAACGASGYLLKDIRPEDLLASIRTVAEGTDLPVRDRIDEVRNRRQVTSGRSPVLDRLTPQERRIAELIVQGLTNREIADQLFLAEKTVRNYTSNALTRVGLRNRTELAAAIVRGARLAS